MSRRIAPRRYWVLLAGLSLFCWYGCSDQVPVGPGDEALSPQLGVQGRQDALGQAIAAQRRATPQLMDDSDVVGTGIGLTTDGRPSIKVFLKDPGVRGIPSSIDGVPVETMVTGEIFALDLLADQVQQEAIGQGKGNGKGGGGGRGEVDHTARLRPVPLGVSTGHPTITACTVGAILDGPGSDPLILSNNHCYAAVNAASMNDPVIQPGAFDGGSSPGDNVGVLVDYEPIDFGGLNTLDAAVARATTAVSSSTTSDCYGTPKSTTIAAAVNMKVQKCGRTTGQTSGTIQAINATVNVNYGGGRIALFVGQIVTTNMSAGGDSGSLLVAQGKGRNKADDRKPVGLLFAGSSAITIHNPIGAVLSRFNATVVGE